MHAAPDTVISPVTLELIGPETSMPVEAELCYDPADPFAVAVDFLMGLRSVRWVFARDLLIAALHEPTGRGDVHAFPSLDVDGRAVVVLELRSPDGGALLEASSRDVIAFLARSSQAVWPGTESEHLAVDAAIAAILVDTSS